MFERVLNTPLFHGHFSYAQNLRLLLMKLVSAAARVIKMIIVK